LFENGALRFSNCCDEGVYESAELQYFLFLSCSSYDSSASVKYLSFFRMLLIFLMKVSSANFDGLLFLVISSRDSYDEKNPMGFLMSLNGPPVVVQSYFSFIHN
jgi:hypothetical protein